jgi:hypothetical protein
MCHVFFSLAIDLIPVNKRDKTVAAASHKNEPNAASRKANMPKKISNWPTF